MSLYSQQVAVEREKMNNLFAGVENPIKILVEGQPCQKIVAKALLGNLNKTSDNCHYIYTTDSCRYFLDKILIGLSDTRTIVWIDTLEYRIKIVPEPTPSVAGMQSGIMFKEKLLKSTRIKAGILNIGFDFNVQVTSYSVYIKRNDTKVFEENDISGSKFTERLISEIENLERGDTIVFHEISVESEAKMCWNNIIGIVHFIID